jgi:hypothetical protein
MKELNKLEMLELNGGAFPLPTWFKGSIYAIMAGYIIDHWPDLKAGIVDGYTDAKNES